MRKLITVTALSFSLFAAACSAGPDEPRSVTAQALDNGGGATDITTYAQCIMGCVSAVDYCEKHQSSELNCAEKGEECMAYCDWAFPRTRMLPIAGSPAVGTLPKASSAPPSTKPTFDGIATSPGATADGIATSPGVSAGANTDGITTSPGVSALAVNIGIGGGGISTGLGIQQCIPVQTCNFVCDPPLGPDDIYHCKLRCTYACP